MSDLRTYVLYTSNSSSVDGQFALLDDSERYNQSSFMSNFKTAENGSHRVVVFSAFDHCYDALCDSLENVEFLGCENNNACCRENPSKHFSEDDWAKVDLANARGLF